MNETTLPKLLVSKAEADKKIQAQIEKGQQLHDLPVDLDDELEKICMEAQNWSKYNTDLLIRLFDNPVLAGYISYDYHRPSDSDIRRLLSDDYISDIHKYQIGEYQTAMGDSISSLEGIRDRLELFNDPSDTPQHPFGDEVFIVHGRDDGTKQTVARFVEQFGIEATILHEKPSSGLTIIEKIEKYSDDAGFAIVLITPDDVGALKDKADDESNPRARQNVIFELGYFMGKLGRDRVCPLFKGEVEKPSDIDGVVYVPMDSTDGWQLKLATEMKQAGLPVDLNKLA